MKLYHASRIKGLKNLKPHPHNAVDGESVVFATTDPLFALAMTYGSGNVLAASYSYDKNTGKQQFYLDELKENSLKLLENPASLYIIEKKNFIQDKRLKDEEFISKKEVKIIREIKIKNVLKELKRLGAKIIVYDNVLVSMKERGKGPKKPIKRYKADRFKEIKK